jgi:hypothetical protein
MAGEIVKGTVNLKSVNNQNVEVVGDGDGKYFLNQIAAYNYDIGVSNVLAFVDKDINPYGDSTPKLLVDQGKQFVTTQVTWDPNTTSATIVQKINDRIAQWISTYGARYDDFKITINNSGGGTHDIMITIIRYF